MTLQMKGPGADPYQSFFVKIVRPFYFQNVLQLVLFFYERCSILMEYTLFPQAQFRRALSVTCKLKEHLQPFVRQVVKNNMQWIFFMCSELYQYFTALDCDINYKFNSLAALKILMDTCEFPIILVAETYFLPQITKIAEYQLSLNDKIRGIDYFSGGGYQKSQTAKKFGYNYVRLACEMVSIFAVVKPYRLFKNQQISDQSGFLLALQHLKNLGWKEYDSLVFYTESPLQMRDVYLQKMNSYFADMNNYQNFVRHSLDNIIRKDLHPIGLDIRRILESYEVHALNIAFDVLREMVQEESAVTLINAFKLTTDLVRWGNVRTFYLIQVQGVFNQFFDMIIKAECDLVDNERGKYAFELIDGDDDDRRNLYQQALKSLQVWTACIALDLTDQGKQSRVTELYKKLKNDLHLQFPYVGNLKKIRNQSSENFDRHKHYNRMEIKQRKGTAIGRDAMRRGSAELKQLLSTNSYTKKNLKSAFSDRYYNKNNRSDIKQRSKEDQDDSSSDQESPKELGKENYIRAKIQKCSTFTEYFFRQKKKKRPLRSINSSVENSQLTMTENMAHQVKQSLSESLNMGSNLKQQMMKFRTSMLHDHDKAEKDEDNQLVEEQLDWNTNYSDQLEEQSQAKGVKEIKKTKCLLEISKKRLHQVVFKITQPQIQKTGVSKDNRSQKGTINSQSNKTSVQMLFFQESESSLSSISNSSTFKQNSIPRIAVIGPHQPNDKSKPCQTVSLSSTFSKKLPTLEKFYKLQEKVVSLQAEKAHLKQELQNREKQLIKLRKEGGQSQIDRRQSIFSWSKFLFSQSDIKESSSDNKLSVNSQNKQVFHSQCISNKILNQVMQLREIDSRKLLKNKDILLKNDKIEIGFIFELGRECGEMSLFVTPSKELNCLSYTIKSGKNVKYQQISPKLTCVSKFKQKRIIYKVWVNPPYLLPQFDFRCEMDGVGFNYSFFLPISFNKFIRIDSYQLFKQPKLLVRQTNIGMLNKKLFRSSQSLLSQFSNLKLRRVNTQQEQLLGSVVIDTKRINLRVLIQNGDFVQIQYSLKEEDGLILEKAEFFVLTLFYVITK